MNWNSKYKNIKIFLCFVHFPFSQPQKIHNKEYTHYLIARAQYLTSAVYRLCNESHHDGHLSPGLTCHGRVQDVDTHGGVTQLGQVTRQPTRVVTLTFETRVHYS